MKIKINKSCLKGEIKAPPSKSYAHRFLIGASLAKGESKIEGIIDSADMKATLSCISALGVKYQKKGDSVSVFGVSSVCGMFSSLVSTGVSAVDISVSS